MVALNAWCVPYKNGVLLRVFIQPNASQTKIVGEYRADADCRLKISVACPPVEGAANEALLKFLKKRLRVTNSQLEILRGLTSRQKDITIAGVAVDQVVALVRP